jgi:TRAP-type C4-dicarboxylate transport system permease small subunit
VASSASRRGLRGFRRAVDGFDRAVAVACCVLVIALLGCVALGVVTRALRTPFIWTDELSRFLMIWLAVFGWIVASRKRLHVRIRFFQDLLPRTAHRGVELALQLAVTLFGALVFVYSVVLVQKNHDLEATTLPISIAWMYVPMVLAGAVTAAQGARELVEAWRRPGMTAVDEGEADIE